MFNVLKTLGVILVVAVVLAVTYGFYRTWKTGRSADYSRFSAGIIPSTMPEGLWKGSVDELGDVSWKGKKFLGGGRGINLFEKSGVQHQAYPFAFSETDSIGFQNKKVIRLDYNQKENPLWLRFIVDEMVSTGPEKFLGVVYIKFIPGFPFRMGYFTLER